MRWIPGIAAMLLSMAFGVGSAAFQDATPASYPVAPDPAECVVAPARIADVVAIVGTPVATPEPGIPTPFVIPSGELADEETTAQVVATLHQVFACANAGDLLRVAALYSDDFVREFFAGAPPEDLREFLLSPAQPLPEDQQRIIRGVGGVQMLDDGRAGVVIVLDEPSDPRTEEPDLVILEQVAGRWLVDEIHEDPSPGGTPPAGTPAA